MPSLIKPKFPVTILWVLFFVMISLRFVWAEELPLKTMSSALLEDARVLKDKNLTSGQDTGYLLSQEDEKLPEVQRLARMYRNQGFQLQNMGDLDRAMGFYQKAIEMDPAYVVVYNDLGIIYETKGFPEKAEELYLKAIEIDPYYLSLYSNLAFLYENKGDFEKASLYWGKRVDLARDLGIEDDPWTEKARQRLEDISSILGQHSEYELVSFMKDIAKRKAIQRRNDQEFAKASLEKAKKSYSKGDYAAALKQAIDAQQLDPNNEDISSFIEKIQLRALSR